MKLPDTFAVKEGDHVDDVSDTTLFDQPYTPLHQTAEDVTIVAAKAGSEDTDWIFDFCDE